MNKPKAMLKVRKKTREVVAAYRSATEAAKENGMASTSVIRATKGMSVGEFYFRFAEGFDPDEDFTGMKNCPVIARDEKTGQVAWYCDAATAAEKLGVERWSIYGSINHGSKVRNRITFAYYGKKVTIDTVDRASVRWRGHHMPTLYEAAKTGEPAFKMEPPEPTDAVCPICRKAFKTLWGDQECCSASCAAKMRMVRRTA